MTPQQEARSLLVELQRRMAATPLAYVKAWDAPPPKTSQRRALLLDVTRDAAGKLPRFTAIFGGNRSGKSEALAQWCMAQGGGLDAYHETPRGRVYWVKRWLAINGFPEEMVKPGPGRVWVGSPTFDAACEQIRPKLSRYAPAGTKPVRWLDPMGAELRIPTGGGRVGVIVSKAYKGYDQNPQNWEGATIRALGFDEEPNSYENWTAGLSRLIDQDGRAMMALTHLRGTSDWLITEIVNKAPSWFRSCYLFGGDNPHIPQAAREEILAAFPAWQRAARDRGEIVDPSGAVYSIRRDVHVIPRMEPPREWVRFRGFDWGGHAPHCVWVAEVAEEYALPDGRTLHTGDLVVYREVALRSATSLISPTRFLEEVKRAEAGSPEAMALSTIYSVGDSAEKGACDLATERGMPCDYADKHPGSIMEGVALVEALIQWEDPVTKEARRPRLYFTADVPVTLEEMQGLRWGEPQPGRELGPDRRCADHGPDAVRYVVEYRRKLGFR